MATERDFITPNGMFISTTANVVGNTTFVELYGDTIISNTGPSLFINFTKGVMDPRIRWTRGSTATYVDKDDIIRTANVNEPRFQYSNGVCQGLLVEEQRFNFFCNERVDGNGTLSASPTTIGPDGKAAYRFVPRSRPFVSDRRTGYDWVGIVSSQSITLTNGQTQDFTFTGYLGPSFGPINIVPWILLEINFNNASSARYCYFAVNTASWSITSANYDAGWSQVSAPTLTVDKSGMRKFSWTARFTADSTVRDRIRAYIQLRDGTAAGNGSGEFITDGVSGIEYSCCQGELASEASTYIPTGTTAVTRLADIGVIDGENFSSWYNQRGGTLYVSADQYAGSVNRGLVTISDGSQGNVAFHIFTSSTLILGEVGAGASGGLISQPGTSYSSTVRPTFKIAQTVSANNSLHYNGALVGSDVIAAIPTVNRMIIGDNRFGNGDAVISGPFDGIIKTIAFYPTPLTSNQAITLTTL